MSAPAPARSTSVVLVAEAIGSFLLVIAIVGTTLFAAGTGEDSSGNGGAVAYLAVSIAAGLAMVGAISAFGHMSGGHFTPAVTLGLAAAGRFPWRQTAGYIAAQVIGGALATTVVVLIGLFGPTGWLETAQDNGFASNGWGALSPAGFGMGGAIITEAIFAALFVMVYLGATHRRRAEAGAAAVSIGLAFAVVHLATLPIDRTGINPARSIATAIYGGPEALAQLWVFIVLPLVGALLAGIIYRALFGGPENT